MGAAQTGVILATNWFMVAFRAIHILAGVVWVGSVFMFIVFVQPSAAAIAPAGAPFMSELLGTRRLVDRLIGAAAVAVVAGLILYVRDLSDAPSFGDFVTSGFGLALTLGALASLVALGLGVFGTRPNVMRMLAIGRAAAEAGGPTPEQAAEIGAIQIKLKGFANVSLPLLVFAVLAMATARYW